VSEPNVLLSKLDSTDRNGIRRNLKPANMRMALRIFAGIIVSVLIAQGIGLKFAASTSIVTLLGIQATKKETIRTAVLRVISIAYTIGIAYLIYRFFGVTVFSFCLAVLILTFLTYLLGWNSTLSVNVVVLVHLFMQQLPFTGALIVNETIRVVIGMLIALAINWRQPDREDEFISDMANIEQMMSHILATFANILRGNEKCTEELSRHLTELKDYLASGKSNAYFFANNNLAPHAAYYMHYISMRQAQSLMLYIIYRYIEKMDDISSCPKEIISYADAIARGVALGHDRDEIAEQAENAAEALNRGRLPETQEVFLNLSLCYSVKRGCDEIVEAQNDFIASLTDEERSRYLRGSIG
jgi:uncharacterized membrane protein YgaE (UPF0421/DUF939 family)